MFKLTFTYFILLFASASLAFAEEQYELPKLGVLADLSANASYLGVMTKIGAEIAAEELKQQGNPINLVIEDSMLKPAQAVSASQKMLYSDQIDGLYVDMSNICSAVSPVLKNNKKLGIFNAIIDSPITSNSFAFKTFISVEEGCELLARHYKNDGKKIIAVSRVSLEFGDLCLSGVKKVYPEAIDTVHDIGADLSTQILTLKAKKAEAIISAAYEIGFLNLIKATSTINFNVAVGTLEDNVPGAKLADYPSTKIQEITSYGAPELSPRFLEMLSKKVNINEVKAPLFAAMSYLHIKQMAQVIRSCPHGDIECQVAKMEQSRPDDTFGFKGYRNHRADIPLVLRRWNGKKFIQLTQ